MCGPTAAECPLEGARRERAVRQGSGGSVLRSSAMRLVVAVLAVAAAGCEGSEGTLLLRHDAAAGAGPDQPPELYLPQENARWTARLDGAVDIAQAADFFYLDPDQQPADDLAALREQGRPYLCYLSAGTVEDFRADAGDFPEHAVGNVLVGFPNERWLDVRDATVRELMSQRVERLAAVGCRGVNPASLAAYEADTGFALSLTDSVEYARFIAGRLHEAGMSAGLTAPAALTQELWQNYDFGLAIGCVATSACREYAALAAAGKPVLHVELGEPESAPMLCKSAQDLGFSALVSDPGFGGRCELCRDIL